MSQCTLGAGLTTPERQSPRAGQRVAPRLSTRGLGLAAGRPAPRSAPTPTPAASPHEVPAGPRAAETEAQKHPQPVLGAPEMMRARPHHGPPGSPGSTFGHMPEELLALPAVKHRRQWGRAGPPGLSGSLLSTRPLREVQPLGSRPRPPATGCHRLRRSVSKYLGDLLPVWIRQETGSRGILGKGESAPRAGLG